MNIDLEGPSGWLRAGGWAEPDTDRPASAQRARRQGPSLGSASA